MAHKRVYADRREYMMMAVSKRRRMIKERIVSYKGGKCVLCGYKKCIWALDLHHLDETQKMFGLSASGLTRSWERTRAEADKCVVLCANCHREVHAGVASLEGFKPKSSNASFIP